MQRIKTAKELLEVIQFATDEEFAKRVKYLPMPLQGLAVLKRIEIHGYSPLP
jgi:hypothetical protein